jgi:hypothetical protein
LLTDQGTLQLLHKPVKHPQRIPRVWRVAFRLVNTTVWTLLPLAEESINSLALLSIITGSRYLCLVVEIYGQCPKGAPTFEWKNDWENGYEEIHGGDNRMIRTIYGAF